MSFDHACNGMPALAQIHPSQSPSVASHHSLSITTYVGPMFYANSKRYLDRLVLRLVQSAAPLEDEDGYLLKGMQVYMCTRTYERKVAKRTLL